jgi:hypothetical protein
MTSGYEYQNIFEYMIERDDVCITKSFLQIYNQHILDDLNIFEEVETKIREEFWSNLSANPNVTLDMIIKNINKPWNYRMLSKNPNINWEFISNNLDKKWNWELISDNPNITWNDIVNNLDKPWDWKYISKNPNITWEIIINNSKMPWDWKYISKNPNITWEIINTNHWRKWSFKDFSYNPNLTIENVISKPNKDWDWKYILKNLKFDIDYLRKLHIIPLYHRKKLYKYLSFNINIPIEYIKDNPGSWNPGYISCRYNLDWETIINSMDKIKYDWNIIAANFNISIEKNHPKNDPESIWNPITLSMNYNLTMEIINKNLLVGYDWEYISLNPTLDWLEDILPNIDKPWNWISLSKNLFTKSKIPKLLEYYKSENYKKRLVRQFLDKCWEELIKTTCHPSRT